MKIKIILTTVLLAVSQSFLAQEVKVDRIADSLKVINEQNIEKQKAEKEAKREVERVQRKKEKAEREAENSQKETERQQKKLERQQKKVEKEQKRQEREREKIADAQKDLARAKEKLVDEQNDMIKDDEKYNKKLAKGKLSPNDIEDYNKDKAKQLEKIDRLKEKIAKAEKNLNKVIN